MSGTLEEPQEGVKRNRERVGDPLAKPTPSAASCPGNAAAAECGEEVRPEGPPFNNRPISHRFATGADVEIYKTMAVRKARLSPEEAIERHRISEFQRHTKKAPRGKVRSFSNDSRMRLMHTLGRVGRQDPAWFVGLSYKSGSVEFEESKRHLDRFGMFLRRQGAECGTVWRYEVTTGKGKRAKGKTPHFHLLVWNEDWNGTDWGELRDRLATAWCRITGDKSPEHHKHGCFIEQRNDCEVTQKNYLVGHHMKKSEQVACQGGRHWGILGRQHLQLGRPQARFSLTPEQRLRYDRVVRKHANARRRGSCKKASKIRELHTVLDAFNTHRLLAHLTDGGKPLSRRTHGGNKEKTGLEQNQQEPTALGVGSNETFDFYEDEGT